MPHQVNANRSQQFLIASVLAGIVSVSFSWMLVPVTVDAAELLPKGAIAKPTIPTQILDTVRKDLAKKLAIAPVKLQVKESSRQTWPDGCLGLPKPDEFCTMALVDGWRVVLSDGKKNWTYRTDDRGRILRLEQQSPKNNK